MMRLLVLGGTHHVGRAVVETAIKRGDTVTTLNRGLSKPTDERVETLIADRLDYNAVCKAVGNRTWDAVIDTWAFAPKFVNDTAKLLKDKVKHYGFVSSRAVYPWPWSPGADENEPLIAGDPDSEDSKNYAPAKRGSEIAVQKVFGDKALLARAGMIIGTYEHVERISWWLRRLEQGGKVIALGPPETSLQFIDARDMAGWMLLLAERGIGGAYNIGSRPGIATLGELINTMNEIVGKNAEIVWVEKEVLERENLMIGTEFGLRSYPGLPEPTGIHDANTEAAHQAGLICRPLRETLEDTWEWIQKEGYPASSTNTWFDPDKEKALLNKL